VKNEITLGKMLRDCPEPWQKFINSLDINPDPKVDDKVLETNLKDRYNAKLCKVTVTFATPDDLTLFVLAWS
jgi:hypothetical protein